MAVLEPPGSGIHAEGRITALDSKIPEMNLLDRRTFLLGTGSILGAAAVQGCLSPGAGGGKPAGRPNVVLILADDMGYGDLSCQATDEKVPTPNLDRLAKDGMRFTDAHSPSSVCSPTRYGILTGRYCWRSRLKRGVLGPWDPPLIEPGRLTLPEMLRRRGYRTACIGKWHLGWDWPLKAEAKGRSLQFRDRKGRAGRAAFGRLVDFSKPVGGGPTTQGFDYYFGDDVPNYPPYAFIENDRLTAAPSVEKPRGMFGFPGPMVPGWRLEGVMPELARRAESWIDERAREGGRPFFLYLPLTAPHTPIVPAEEFRGKTKGGPYGDYVFQVDWTVGRVLEAIKRNSLEENTLVIFTSDNGSPARNGKNASGAVGSEVRDYGHHPSAFLRGLKGDSWDGGHRVPFLARWPGVIPAGGVSAETICHVDIFATLAGVLDYPLPRNVAEDSWDILPALRGIHPGRPVRGAVVHHSFDGMFCIRKGRWKLILGRGSGGFSRPRRVKPRPGEPQGQLYDMKADVRERRNLWSLRPEIVEELSALLKKWRRRGFSRPM